MDIKIIIQNKTQRDKLVAFGKQVVYRPRWGLIEPDYDSAADEAAATGAEWEQSDKPDFHSRLKIGMEHGETWYLYDGQCHHVPSCWPRKVMRCHRAILSA